MFEIKEINGIQYRVMLNGGLLKYTPKKDVVCGVYCITETTTGKKYIGSSNDVNKRIKSYLKPSRIIQGVLRDIDTNNIVVELLEIVDSAKLLLRESHYIETLNTKYPIGFNKKCPLTNKAFNGYIKRSNLTTSVKKDLIDKIKETATPKLKRKNVSIFKNYSYLD